MVAPAVFSSILPLVIVGAVGLYVLVKSAGIVVDRLISIAQAYDVPDTLIAMSVIAIGTSLPEIASHITASLGITAGTLDYGIASATVLGGNMGSSIAQQTLLVGLFLIGFGTMEVSRRFLRLTYIPMVLASMLTLTVAWDRTISQLDGLLLFGVFLIYMYYSFNRRERGMSVPDTASKNVKKDGFMAFIALLAVLASAFMVLWVAENIIQYLRLGGSMVGVITIGIASALPELSTVLTAVKRKSSGIALGTLIGSNIVNPLVAIGLGGMISTYVVPEPVVLWDLPFKIAIGVGLLAYLLFISEKKLGRKEGVYLVIAYFVFIAVRFIMFLGQ